MQLRSNKFFILFIILLIATLNFKCKKCEDIQVPYTEEIPYEAEETYYDTPKYDVLEAKRSLDYDCEEYNIWGTCVDKNWYVKMYVTIQNYEDIPVKFHLTHTVYTNYDTVRLNKDFYVPANSTKTVYDKYYIHNEEEYYTINVYYYVEAEKIQRTRTVTKYRKVTKYRNCNTCVEDCSQYLPKKKSRWWVYAIIGFFVISFIYGLIDEYL